MRITKRELTQMIEEAVKARLTEESSDSSLIDKINEALSETAEEIEEIVADYNTYPDLSDEFGDEYIALLRGLDAYEIKEYADETIEHGSPSDYGVSEDEFDEMVSAWKKIKYSADDIADDLEKADEYRRVAGAVKDVISQLESGIKL